MSADIPALKDQIRELKARKLELETEKADLLHQNLMYETKASECKQELNVLSAVNELRYAVIEDGATIFTLKMMEANRKLELQILNPEIKGALPILESQALEWEAKVNVYEKSAQEANARHRVLPKNLMLSSDEIVEEIGKLYESRVRLKTVMTQEVENRKQMKLSLSKEIRSLRDVAQRAEEDIQIAQSTATKAKLKLMAEEVRVEVLMKVQQDLCSEISLLIGTSGSANETTDIA